MIRKMIPFLFMIGLIFIAAIVILQNDQSNIASQPLAINPAYEQMLGFLKDLGQISPVTNAMTQSADKVTYQIFDPFILAYNPAAPADQQVYVVPIARHFKLGKLPSTLIPVDQPQRDNMRVSDGIRLWDELFPILDKYGKLIGKPLTPLVYNQETDSYEQYFETMGFYRKQSDPSGQIKLLHYGKWWYFLSASNDGGVQEPLDGTHPDQPPTIISARQAEVTMLGYAARLNNFEANFTGARLSAASETKDKMYEMVFENLVMYLDPENPQIPHLRPVTLLVGTKVQPVESRAYDSQNTFFMVENELGYNVRTVFSDYASQHSGLSGKPIHSTQKQDGFFLQCFENYCLEMPDNPLLGSNAKIDLLPLGRKYLEITAPQAPASTATATAAPTSTPEHSDKPKRRVFTWYIAADLLSGKKPRIGAAIFENLTPLSDAALYVTIYMPNGGQVSFSTPPTNSKGQTEVTLAGIESAAGNFLNYDVCLEGKEDYFCNSGSFYYQP